MLGIRHPFTRALYEQDGAGAVLVDDAGVTGLFTSDGRWISGDLRECDPHLCGWVSGPVYANYRMVVPESTAVPEKEQ